MFTGRGAELVFDVRHDRAIGAQRHGSDQLVALADRFADEQIAATDGLREPANKFTLKVEADQALGRPDDLFDQ